MRASAIVAALLASCYQPNVSDCVTTCATSGICPDGFACLDGFCRAPGAAGSCAAPDGGADAVGGEDAAADGGGQLDGPNPDTPPTGACHDGVLDFGEECDDGNADDNDSCVDDCRSARCGDDHVWSYVEECDDGNAVDTDGCSNFCLACADGSAHFTDPTTGSCYWLFDLVSVNFNDAATTCAASFGHLATFDSYTQQDTVLGALGSPDGAWIGLTSLATGAWHWVTHQVVAYNHWAVGNPAMGQCAVVNTVYDWVSRSCVDVYPFVCEREPWTVASNGHAYRLFPNEINWLPANSECFAHGAHLVTISSSAEQSVVDGLVFTDTWIGLSEGAVGDFSWTTSEPYPGPFTGWAITAPDGPGGECVIDSSDGWHDIDCTIFRPFVCEND